MHDSQRIARRASRSRWSLCAVAALLGLAIVIPASVLIRAQVARGATAGSGQLTLRSGVLTLTLLAKTYSMLTLSTGGALPETRSLNPIAPGATYQLGVFSFPVKGGSIDPATLTGSASSRGGITFESVAHDEAAGQNSLVQFKLTGFALDFSSAPAELTATFAGQQTYHDLPIATLVISQASVSHHGRRVTIAGLGLTLLADGVELFNQQAFNNQAHRFKVGEAIGTVSLAASS